MHDEENFQHLLILVKLVSYLYVGQYVSRVIIFLEILKHGRDYLQQQYLV